MFSHECPPKRRTMDRHRNHIDSTSPEPDLKRRKLRKGTTSCWDCKKRKVKCTYDATSDTVCIACHRRGAPCIGQDQPEQEYQLHTESNRDPLLNRIERVESLLEQLIKLGHRVDRNINSTEPVRHPEKSGYFTPVCDYQSLASPSPLAKSCVAPITNDASEKGENRKISEELLKAFPSQEEVNSFYKSDYIATFYCHQLFTHSDERPEHEAFDFVNNLARIPHPSTHPVLVAKRMIILALFLQYFRAQNWSNLPEDPNTIMERLVETAVRLVTSNEKLICCIEGIECIVLEGLFRIKGGNLRQAWLAFRKAIVIAQLMKIDLPKPPVVKSLDSGTEVNSRFMWFRILYMDSMLSLMLGLPHGGEEANLGHEIPGETPTWKLERTHTLVGRRIIDRNRRNSFHEDFETTRELDQELLKAAKALPDKFWSPPKFNTLQPNTRAAFWEMMRLCDQVHHYNLVHLLHLPYLLRSDKESTYTTYSKITCINASREVLSRSIAFRHFNFKKATVYCRSADFLALMASMTILLAHIDSHKSGVEDWRVHQRLGDRAMVEELLEILVAVGKSADDNLTHQSAEQLQRLLDIESDTARGMEMSADCTVSCLEENCGDLQLHIPYFGIIKIGREGITKNSEADPTPAQPLPANVPDSIYVANHLISTMGFNEALHHEPQPWHFQPGPVSQPMRGQIPPAKSNAGNLLQEPRTQSPTLMASVNDWAFQGVDAAFFDSVMRGTVNWDPALQSNV